MKLSSTNWTDGTHYFNVVTHNRDPSPSLDFEIYPLLGLMGYEKYGRTDRN